MPSTKKRINLTFPDDLYLELQAYKAKNGIESDASACIQLITKQLNGAKQTEELLNFIARGNLDQLMQISGEGLRTIKELADSKG